MRWRGDLLRASVAAVALTLLAAACAISEPDPVRAGPVAADQSGGCTWPMAGQNLSRTHASACTAPDAIGSGTLDRLEQVWFTETKAEVTGAPAVTKDSLYFGDWSGRIYAVSRATGKIRWTRDTPIQPLVYAGQIPASPTITTHGGSEVLVIASGRTVWMLRTADGAPVWHRELGNASDPKDPTEIEGSPAVAGDLVVVPTDVHNDQTHRSGVVALSLADGTVRWTWDPERGRPPGGCGSVWGTPAVDLDAGLAVVGTGSCFHEGSWTRYSEAIVGLDLRTGKPRWSYQPRPKINNQDWDFAGAANLFTISGQPVVGLGNKDGRYYVVDEHNGDLVWQAQAVRQSSDGDGYAFGGFIGATSVAPDSSGRFVVTGGTAVGDCPCQHAFDASTGKPIWQNPKPGGTYAASGSAGGVVFTAGIDQTLRAVDLDTGKILWHRLLPSISASGPAIAGDFLAIGVGFREPETNAPPSGGVVGYRVLAPDEQAPPSSTTTLPVGPAVTALVPSSQDCVGAPCDIDFTLKDPPPGHAPTMTLEVDPNPLKVTVKTADLGEPSEWLAPDGPGNRHASAFAIFITPRDDKPELGSILCVLGADGSCTADTIDLRADQYTRLSLVALSDGHTPPTLLEGFDRLVTTHSFDPGLVPAP